MSTLSLRTGAALCPPPLLLVPDPFAGAVPWMLHLARETQHARWVRWDATSAAGPDPVQSLDLAVRHFASPPVLVAQGHGSLVVARWAACRSARARGALLTELPPRPRMAAPSHALPFPTLVVHQQRECPHARSAAAAYAQRWRGQFVPFEALGAEAGYSPRAQASNARVWIDTLDLLRTGGQRA